MKRLRRLALKSATMLSLASLGLLVCVLAVTAIPDARERPALQWGDVRAGTQYELHVYGRHILAEIALQATTGVPPSAMRPDRAQPHWERVASDTDWYHSVGDISVKRHRLSAYDPETGKVGAPHGHILYFRLPVLYLAFPPLVLAAAKLLAAADRRRKRQPGLCPLCGYDLRATPTRCPECGHTPPHPDPAAAQTVSALTPGPASTPPHFGARP